MVYRAESSGGSARRSNRGSKSFGREPSPQPGQAPKAPRKKAVGSRSYAKSQPTKAVGPRYAAQSAPASPAPLWQDLPPGNYQTSDLVFRGASGGGGGGGGFSGGGGGGGIPAPAPLEPQGPSMADLKKRLGDYDWLRGQDAQFAAGEAAYKRALDQLLSTLTREDKDYDTEFGRALGSIGYRDLDNDYATRGGEFQWDNADTAAGRSLQNMMNDFASRGMLQGTAFGDARNSLDKSLTDQVSGLFDTRQQFRAGQNEKRTQGKETYETNRKLAASQALDRIAAALGAI